MSRPCSVCGVEVEVEIVRPTVPTDWEYRFQVSMLRYLVPGTENIHHCRIKLSPQVPVAYTGPQEDESPPPPVEPPTYRPAPEREQASLTSALRFLDGE